MYACTHALKHTHTPVHTYRFDESVKSHRLIELLLPFAETVVKVGHKLLDLPHLYSDGCLVGERMVLELRATDN